MKNLNYCVTCYVYLCICVYRYICVCYILEPKPQPDSRHARSRVNSSDGPFGPWHPLAHPETTLDPLDIYTGQPSPFYHFATFTLTLSHSLPLTKNPKTLTKITFLSFPSPSRINQHQEHPRFELGIITRRLHPCTNLNTFVSHLNRLVLLCSLGVCCTMLINCLEMFAWFLVI